VAQKAALAKASSWERREIFPEAWVTLPGDSWPDGNLIAACSKLVLEKSAKNTAS